MKTLRTFALEETRAIKELGENGISEKQTRTKAKYHSFLHNIFRI